MGDVFYFRRTGAGLKLHQGTSRLGMRKDSLEGAVRHCTAAQGGGGIAVPGGVQSCGDVALREVGSGHGGVGRGWIWGSEGAFPTAVNSQRSFLRHGQNLRSYEVHTLVVRKQAVFF